MKQKKPIRRAQTQGDNIIGLQAFSRLSASHTVPSTCAADGLVTKSRHDQQITWRNVAGERHALYSAWAQRMRDNRSP